MKSKRVVITADLVNSSVLNAQKINIVLKNIKKNLPSQFTESLEIFRGDSIQIVVDAADALDVLLLMRSTAIASSPEKDKRIDLRVSIAFGKIERNISREMPGYGEAFTLSGRALESISKSYRRSIISTLDLKKISEMQLLSLCIDLSLKEITIKQATVLVWLLKKYKQAEIAKKLKVSQAAIQKHTEALGWPYINTLIEIYKLILPTL